MLPKKFLYCTLSTLTLSLALSGVALAAETDTVNTAVYNVIAQPTQGHAPDTTTAATSNTAAESTADTASPAPTDNIQTQDQSTQSTQPTTTTQPDTTDTNSTTEQTGTVSPAPEQTTQPTPSPEKTTTTTTTITETNTQPTLPSTKTDTVPAPVNGHAPAKTTKSTPVLVKAAGSPTTKSAPIKATPKIVNHTVKKGDTLYLLAKRYISDVFAIKKTNNLKSNYLYIGQFLKIPSYGTAASSKTVTSTIKYKVKRGDTLYLIGKRYGTTPTSIKSLNKLKSNNLWVGQILSIRTSKSVQVAATGTYQYAAKTLASRYDASRSELLLLARLIFGEARGESYEGQVAVGAVVLNRVKSALFPNSIAGVIYQKYEFSAVLDGQINLNPDQSAMKAAQAALNGYDPTNGALFYWNPVKAPYNSFLNSKPIIARIGDHVFAK